MAHGISERKCDSLSRKHLNELCSHDTPYKFDCIQQHASALTLLQQDLYRISDFSVECYDKCILHYLYSISNPELKKE
jgi:hypothetical protein